MAVTINEVAEHAGVSEGTVFHRFKSKDALFREAMNFDESQVPQLLRATMDGLEAMEIREALITMGTKMVELGRVVIPLMMMTWSNPANRPQSCGERFDLPLPDERKRAGMRDMFKLLASFFEMRMQEGKLRRVDAEIFARVFVGSLHQYSMAELTGVNTGELALPEGIFVRGLVDLLLNGAAAVPDVPPATASTRRLVR